MQVADVNDRLIGVQSPTGVGISRKKQAIFSQTIRNAFVDWLAHPETEVLIDVLYNSALTTRNSKSKVTGENFDASISDEIGLDIHKLPTPPIADISSCKGLPTAPLGDLDQTLPLPLSPCISPARSIIRDPATAPVFSRASSVVGENIDSFDMIPAFYCSRDEIKSRMTQDLPIQCSQKWTPDIEEQMLSVFEIPVAQESATISFDTFEMKVIKGILGLSRYMAGCIFCMMKFGSPEKNLKQLFHALRQDSTGGCSESCHAISPSSTEQAVLTDLSISWGELEKFWLRKALAPSDNFIWNFFTILKDDDDDFIWGYAFKPFLGELLERHPGVEFLKPHADFQKRYLDTVTARMMYDLNAIEHHKITFAQIDKSCLPECWRSLDEETDFNSMKDFFSYEHFYVAYCRFWSLDADHDFRLDKQDLVKYDNHAFSNLTLNRLFEEAGNLLGDGHTIGYEGFFYLLMHDEDKTSDQSIDFWFRILDLNGDGILTEQELSQFYNEQLQRLESRAIDAPSFEVILCQANDMIKPEAVNKFQLRDLKRQRRHAPLFFNTLLSLTKFLAWEHRDPFLQRTEYAEFPFFTDWDRYCHIEYERLSTEEVSEEWDDFSECTSNSAQANTGILGVDLVETSLITSLSTS